jgi:ribonuclease HI
LTDFTLHLTEVELYTDGACSGNPGPGGWGVILVVGDKEKELAGGEPDTTNQRMELQAVIQGLKALNRPCKVKVYSDSAYFINALEKKWYVNWRKNGWKNSKGESVKNRDLWEALLEQMDRHQLSLQKVKGHSGHHYNERCDALARAAVPKRSR